MFISCGRGVAHVTGAWHDFPSPSNAGYQREARFMADPLNALVRFLLNSSPGIADSLALETPSFPAAKLGHQEG